MHTSSNRRSYQRRGFSLIELLVVVAIIGVLVGLLLPAVQSIRNAANRTENMAKMKQIVLAAHSYVDAHQGYLPGSREVLDPGGTPFYRLLPYTDYSNSYSTTAKNNSYPGESFKAKLPLFLAKGDPTINAPLADLCVGCVWFFFLDTAKGYPLPTTGLIENYQTSYSSYITETYTICRSDWSSVSTMDTYEGPTLVYSMPQNYGNLTYPGVFRVPPGISTEESFIFTGVPVPDGWMLGQPTGVPGEQPGGVYTVPGSPLTNTSAYGFYDDGTYNDSGWFFPYVSGFNKSTGRQEFYFGPVITTYQVKGNVAPKFQDHPSPEQCRYYWPVSNTKGALLIGFLDGSVRSVSSSVDTATWTNLMKTKYLGDETVIVDNDS